MGFRLDGRIVGQFWSMFAKRGRVKLRLEVKERPDNRPEAAGCSIFEGEAIGTIINASDEEMEFYYAPGEIHSGVFLTVLYTGSDGVRYKLHETGGVVRLEHHLFRIWDSLKIGSHQSEEIAWPLRMDYESLTIADAFWRLPQPGILEPPEFPGLLSPPVREPGTPLTLLFSYYGTQGHEIELPSVCPVDRVGYVGENADSETWVG